MSHNGVGLKTAKGSSTSGHIQRSLAHNEYNNKNYTKRAQEAKQKPKTRAVVKPSIKDAKLKIHQDKRSIQLQVSEYRDHLEDSTDLTDQDIDHKCQLFKEKLQNEHKELKRVESLYTSRKERLKEPQKIKKEDES
ncbi:hypothetical protein TBLA_0H03360 [Henningerozyma blattae CBS 6284]|uniref:Pre-mRNA-splicing factor CWC21 n=1 Tax=Henningerozyma blattae (strain ATCC 34711 / CBS 6284 / DSM 70876 / NBRC 10599 / NRRL Y-10934 / UCD 77-7) TaxID=1071380 RepID=I2H8B5_HENB6|nr:hypothetical protein TBLA_0H03360 [Tetrapisispora blattae CBS 6284]CCH62617.1 hypothetical protein TBLA_0H03360 [Tetrapisispora blattae CBS 6284]